MLNSTLVGTKPTLSYAKLCTTLARVASIVNDRPIGVCSMTKEEIVPLTVNQLLLGRSTSALREAYTETAQDNYMAANDYQEELLSQWWNRWKIIGLPQLIPYQRFKDAKRHKNLQEGDVCLLQYDGKFKHTYRLCIILKSFPSEGNIVRTVKVGFRPKTQCKAGPYKSVTLDELVVGVP